MKKLRTSLIMALSAALLLSGCSLVAENVAATPASQEEAFVFDSGNFPRICGSTAAAPLGQSVAAVLLGVEPAEADAYLDFGESGRAWEALLAGECGLVLAPELSGVAGAAAKVACDIKPVATDGLMFYVSESNPVSELTREQLRGIYSGEITNWAEVGGEDEPIRAFSREEGSGSRAAAQALIMDGADFVPVSDEPSETVYDGSAGAIGFAFYYHGEYIGVAEGAKTLSIEGVAPTEASIADGSYPLLTSYCAAISQSAGEDSPERVLFDWLTSTEAQNFIATLGYIPVRG